MMRWVVALLLLSGVAFAQSSEPPASGEPPSAQATQQPATDQRGTEQSPLSVKIIPADDADKKAAAEKHEREDKSQIERKLAFETQRVADYTLWIAAFTFLVVIVTGFLGYATWSAAKAARAAAEHIPRVERAYLFVGPDDISAFAAETIVKLGIKNHGKTPAMSKSLYVGLRADPPTGPPSVKGLVHYHMDSAFAAGQEFTAPIEFKWPTTGMFYFVGRIDYDDIFGEPHESWFCALILPDKPEFRAAGPASWNHWT